MLKILWMCYNTSLPTYIFCARASSLHDGECWLLLFKWQLNLCISLPSHWWCKVFDFHPSQLATVKWPSGVFSLNCFSYTWAFVTASLRCTLEFNLLHHLKCTWILESQRTENRDSQIVIHGLFVACRLVSKMVAYGVIRQLLTSMH